MNLRTSRLGALSLACGLLACGGGAGPSQPQPGTPASIAVSVGDMQQASAGAAVAIAPAVLVRDAQNAPVSGASVLFTVAAGGGTVEGGTTTTDASGIARVGKWTLGAGGEQRLSATTGTLTALTFHATVLPNSEVLTASFGPGGGTFEITTTGHPYKGFKLAVPVGTYASPGTFNIRSLDGQTPPTLPAGFQVVGPILEIATVQPRGDALMTVDIPVTQPSGTHVVIVLRDPATGVMEVMPMVARSATSVRVLTAHLRGDLLLGPNSQPGLLANSRLASVVNLFAVSMPLPLPPAGPVMNNASDRWPVIDHGSAQSPVGLSAGIASLQSLAKIKGYPLTTAVIKPMATPGFYADKGVLAAALMANDHITHSIGPLGKISSELASLTKTVRDELVHDNIVASIGLASSPVTIALHSAGQLSHFATAIAGSNTELTIINASTSAPITWARNPASGYASLALSVTPDKPNVSVDQPIPMSSFTTNFAQIGTLLQDLITLSTLSGAARETKNNQMAQQAGIPDVTVEVEGAPGLGFVTAANNAVVARTPTTAIRIPTLSGAGMILNIPTSGAEIGRVTGSQMSLSTVPSLVAAPVLVPTDVVLSPFAVIGGVTRQVSAKLLQFVKAPFDVSPVTSTYSKIFTLLQFSSSIPMAPNAYLVEWDWGDGHLTSYNGSPVNFAGAGSHAFEQVKDYKVIATLYDKNPVTVLAADTVEVRVGQAAHWRLSSTTDVDGLLVKDDEGEYEVDFPAPLRAALERLIERPATGLLSLLPVTATKGQMQVRIDTDAWSTAQCCPPPHRPAEFDLSLGEDEVTNYAFGPFFAGWGSANLTMPPDFNTGSINGQFISGTHTYSVKNGGTQTGPAGATRITATLNGTLMTGTFSIWIWFIDDDSGQLEDQPGQFRFNFTATRLR